MSKRYREAIEVTTTGDAAPATFRWRGRCYEVRAVLGHWREDAGYWAGGGIDIPQRDLWRVEAGRGVFELCDEAGAWRLDRVWD